MMVKTSNIYVHMIQIALHLYHSEINSIVLNCTISQRGLLISGASILIPHICNTILPIVLGDMVRLVISTYWKLSRHNAIKSLINAC